MSNLIYCI